MTIMRPVRSITMLLVAGLALLVAGAMPQPATAAVNGLALQHFPTWLVVPGEQVTLRYVLDDPDSRPPRVPSTCATTPNAPTPAWR